MLLPIVFTIIKILIIVTVILLAVAYMTYAERKVIGAMQVRLGPMHTGPYGLLQPIADAVKLIAKEDLTPDMVDRPVFILAPLLTMVPALAGFAVIPFADNFTMFGMEIKPYITDLNIGLLYVLAISSVGTYGVIMSGWASNSKYALLGSLRSSAQVLSYETAMGLALVAPVLLAGSLSLREITLAQAEMWFVVPQIVAFVVYVIAAIAETNRAEAETEIVAGFHVEYSSMKFALFFLGEYANMYLVSTIAVVMFLGGWNGPFLPPLVWFVIKVLFIMFIFLWLRATLPRLRFDQLMSLGWKVLIPIALANLMITAIVVHIVR